LLAYSRITHDCVVGNGFDAEQRNLPVVVIELRGSAVRRRISSAA
jgi:hypothetical protein